MPSCKNCGRELTEEDVIREPRWKCPDLNHIKVYQKPGKCEVKGCEKELIEFDMPVGYHCDDCGTITT